MNKLSVLFQNKHTSLAAVVVVICKAVGAQWPQYKPFCDTLVDGAIAYGLLLAGDAKPVLQANNTPNETKTPVPVAGP